MAPLFQFPTFLIVENQKNDTWKLHVRVKFGHPPPDSDDNNSFVSLLL